MAVIINSEREKMNQINIQFHKTGIGKIVLGSLHGKLCLLGFGSREIRRVLEDRIKRILDTGFIEQDDEILEKTRRQLDEYLRGCRRQFEIPVLMAGTEFQKTVWNALLKVPYGATRSYRQIAEAIGNARAVRAVGNACRANPIGIIVPCHRIIGSDGDLVGYGGGLSLKRRLLKLEQGGSALGND